MTAGSGRVMGRIVFELADVAIVTSDNPRSEDPLAIVGEIVAGMAGEPSRGGRPRAAIEQAIELAGPGTWSSSPERGTSAARRSQASSRRSTTPR